MSCGRMESSVGLDRLATQEEVRCAMSLSSPGALEFVGLGVSETNSGSNRRSPNLHEEVEWVMIAREMRDRFGN